MVQGTCFHVRNILDKLRLHNRAEALGYALECRFGGGGGVAARVTKPYISRTQIYDDGAK